MNSALSGAQSTYWTAVQACVWLATRDYHAVGRVRGFCTLLEAGYLALPPTRDMEAYREHVDEDISTRVWGAWRDLANACAAGSLRMLGRLEGEGDPVAIPQDTWANLEIRGAGRLGMIAASPDILDRRSSCWDELRVARQTVEDIWPAVGPAPGGATASLLDRSGYEPAKPTTVLRSRTGGTQSMVDQPMLEIIREECLAGASIREAVLRHDAAISGANAEAKIRRLTRKYKALYGA